MWIHRWRKTSGSASTPGPGERTCVKWQNLCHPSVFDPWRWYESVLDCKHVPKPKKELQPIPSSKHRRIIFFSLAVSSESNFYSVLVGFFFGHWLNFLDWQNWPLDFYFTLLSLSLSSSSLVCLGELVQTGPGTDWFEVGFDLCRGLLLPRMAPGQEKSNALEGSVKLIKVLKGSEKFEKQTRVLGFCFEYSFSMGGLCRSVCFCLINQGLDRSLSHGLPLAWWVLFCCGMQSACFGGSFCEA